MPFFHFECPKGHITEILETPKHVGKTVYTLSEILESRKNRKPKTVKCSTCHLKAEQIYLTPHEARMARNFSPTLLFTNPNGDVIMPGRNNPDQLPKRYLNKLTKQGFIQREITNFREYESFIREQRSILQSRQDQQVSQQQSQYDREIREQIEAFRRGDPIEMPNPDGKGSTTIQIRLDDLSPAMRQLAEYSMQQALNHRIKGGSVNPYIDSMEFDNRSYRDEDTSWRKKKH